MTGPQEKSVHYRLRRDRKSSHQQIARLIRERRPGEVLDVGAAQGILGRMLGEDLKSQISDFEIQIDAIEPNAQWAEAARPFYRRVINATVEAAELEEGLYDAIVCADVLEHLADPVGTLKRLRRAAKGDAMFIVSVPNVAHIAVRGMLLFGKFPKMERGILDKTHLQFWTKDTAMEMLREAGLKVEQVMSTVVPLEDMGDGVLVRAMMGMQRMAVAMLPRLFAMQWIFVCK